MGDNRPQITVSGHHGGMHTTPGDADISAFSLYIAHDKPALYVSSAPGQTTGMIEMMVLMCQSAGLPPLVVDAAEGVGIGRAGDGWGIEFEFDQGDKVAPLMTIDWPVSPPPLVYGVRKDSPPGWATDAILAGGCALIVGPPIDWTRIATPLESGHSALPLGKFVHALIGLNLAAGILPVRVRA
jgi:hypothetical protein